MAPGLNDGAIDFMSKRSNGFIVPIFPEASPVAIARGVAAEIATSDRDTSVLMTDAACLFMPFDRPIFSSAIPIRIKYDTTVSALLVPQVDPPGLDGCFRIR